MFEYRIDVKLIKSSIKCTHYQADFLLRSVLVSDFPNVVLLKASRAYEKSLLGVRLGENAALLPILISEFKLPLPSSVDFKIHHFVRVVYICISIQHHWVIMTQ